MSSDYTITAHEIEVALAEARRHGCVVSDPTGSALEPIASMTMEQILRAAYDRRRAADTVIGDLREEPKALRGEVARLQVERDKLNQELREPRAQLDHVDYLEEIQDRTRELLRSLEGAWWLQAADSYHALRRMLDG